MTEKDGLFDATDYDDPKLQLPTVDGQGIDKIKIGFSGSIMLDRSDPHDCELFRKLKLGSNVELRVAGRVAKTATGSSTDADDNSTDIVGERTVKVSSVWRLTPEEL